MDCENIVRIMEAKVYKEKANQKNTWISYPYSALTKETLHVELRVKYNHDEITKELEVDSLWEENKNDDEYDY